MKMFRVVVNGNEYQVGIEELTEVAAIETARKPMAPTPAAQAPPQPVKPQPTATKSEPAAGAGTIVAPMPGTVLRVAAAAGDRVQKGQTLLVLEAMKMENEIMAPADAIVQEMNVGPGVSVNAGQVLAVLSY